MRFLYQNNTYYDSSSFSLDMRRITIVIDTDDQSGKMVKAEIQYIGHNPIEGHGDQRLC